MNLGVHARIAVVTGTTAGIGLAIATALAAEGASVVVNGRTQARVTAAIEQIRRTVEGARVQGVAADLGAASGADAFVREVPEADVLVNNLGIFEAKPFGEIPDADWMRFFEVNVLSGVRLARRYVPGMTARKVNSVLVGPTASEGVGTFVEDLARQQGTTKEEVEQHFFAGTRPNSLLKRFETPEEVGGVVAFVASDHARVINGAAVRADGGVVRSIF